MKKTLFYAYLCLSNKIYIWTKNKSIIFYLFIALSLIKFYLLILHNLEKQYKYNKIYFHLTKSRISTALMAEKCLLSPLSSKFLSALEFCTPPSKIKND